MKKVNLKEEAYKKLIKEIGYGNDDLGNLCNELKYSIGDASQVIRAQCLAYIFRQYDFRQWQSRFDSQEEMI